MVAFHSVISFFRELCVDFFVDVCASTFVVLSKYLSNCITLTFLFIFVYCL